MANKVEVDIDYVFGSMNQSAVSRQIKQEIRGISNTAKKETEQINQLMKKAVVGFAAFYSAQQIKQFILDIANVRGEFQQLDVAFTTILKSKEKADALMSQVVQFAAITPFELKDVAQGTKRLLAYSFAAEDVIDNLRMLGDVSAGISAPIGDIIYLYGTLKAQGRAYFRDIYQFANRGIPIYAELAKVLGIAEDEVQAYVTAGKVGFAEVEKVFKSMTNEGGIFADLTEKQAKTITGLASNFSDAWTRMLNDIGEGNEGMIADSIKTATSLVDNYEDILDVLKVLIATYGTYKAAVITAAVAHKALNFAENIRLISMFRKELGLAKAAQQAFNITASSNPYALALAGLVAITTAIIVFTKKSDDAIAVTEEFQSSLNKAKKEIKEAFGAITDSTEGTKKHADAIQTVNDKYKEYLPYLIEEKMKLEDVKTAQEDVTRAIAKNLAFKAQEKQLSKSKTNVDDDLDNYYARINKAGKNMTDEQKGQFTALIDEYKEHAKKAFESLGYHQTNTFDLNQISKKISGEKIGSFAVTNLDFAIKSLIASEIELDEKTKGLSTTYKSYLEALGLGEGEAPDPIVLKTIAEQIEQTKILLKEAEEKLKEMRLGGSTSTIKELQGQEAAIKDLKTKLTLFTGISKKANTDALKAVEQKLKAQEALGKKEVELKQRIEEAKIAIMQEGVEKQKSIAESSYKKELDRINQQEKDYLKALNAGNGKKPTDAGYITVLPSDVQAKFDGLRTAAEQKKVKEIIQINKDAADQIKNILNDAHQVFLSENDAEIQAIKTKYDGWLKEMKEAGAAQEKIDQLALSRQAEIDRANQKTALKLSDYYQKVFGDLSTYGYKTLTNLVSQTKDVIDSAKQKDTGGQTFILVDIPTLDKEGKAIKKTVTLTIEEFNRLKEKYIDLKNATNKGNPFKALGDSFTDLIDAIKNGDDISEKVVAFDQAADDALAVTKQWGDSLGEIFGKETGDDIKGIINTIDGFKDVGVGIAKLYSGDVVGGITSVLNGFAKLTAGAKVYNEAQEAWTKELIKLQLEYNAVLNEQLRLQEAFNSSVFVTDYINQIKQAYKALDDAQESYADLINNYVSKQSAVEKILIGFGFDIDTSKFERSLEGILADLQIKIDVAKKKFLFVTTGSKDVFGSLLENYPELINQAGRLNVELANTLLNLEGIPDKTAQTLEALIEYENEMIAAQQAIKDVISDLAGSIGGDLQNALVNAWQAGEDQFMAFKNSVSTGLEQILEQMVFAEVFGNAFDQLQQGMEASFATNGDQSWVDDFSNFFNKSPELIAAWEQAMSEAQAIANEAGFDLWSGSSNDPSALQGGIGAVLSEETGSRIEGIARKDSDELQRHGMLLVAQNNHLNDISMASIKTAANTEQTVMELQAVVTKLTAIETNTKQSTSAYNSGLI